MRFSINNSDRKIGMLLFGSKHSNAYTESEIRFLTMLASAVAVAIDDALHFDGMNRAQEELKRSQEESRSEHERLKLLLDFTNAVASNLDFQELLQATLANLRRVMKCDAIWIHLPDAEGKHLPVIARDFPGEKGFYEDLRIPPIRHNRGKSLPGRKAHCGSGDD